MNVRFKPLLILCGFFAVTAMAGVGVWVFGFAGGANDNPELILAEARTERKAGQFDRALIQYRRALQASGGASADIHEEIAGMYAEQEKTAATPQARLDLRISQLRSLVEAAQVDRSRKAPRRQLMLACMAEANEEDGTRWAEELIALDPADADANYLMARKNLSRKALKIDQAKRFLEALAKLEPNSARVDLVTVEVNRESGEIAKNKAIFEKYAKQPLPDNSPPAQQLAWARLRLMAAADNPSPNSLTDLATAMEGLMMSESTSVNHRVEWTRELQQIADRLPNLPESESARRAAFGLMEKSLTQAIRENETDLRLKMVLARHLLTSNRLEASLEIAKRGLDSEEAKNPQVHNVVFGLRDVVVKAYLADGKNEKRFEQAQPYIDAMLADKAGDVQGVGHLFQGAIDLERSGIGGDAEIVAAAAQGEKAAAAKTALDYRKSSLDHLKKAVELLPEVATGRALYGVSLILNREPEMGRQALLRAQAMGIPEVRYQVWAAWSQILAGYPEDALPVVNNLLNRAGAEAGVRIFTPTLYLMMGEIHQARNTPESLRKAYEYYATALKLNPDASNAIHLKVAQLELMLNLREQAEARLKALAGQKETSASAIQLQIYGLVDAGKLEDARKLLDSLRRQNPDSVELLMSDVTIMARESKLEEAVKKLDEFRRRRPEVIEVVQLQVQLMAERLGRIDEARKLIEEHLANHPNSSLQSQSAQLALAAGDIDSVNRQISKLRTQWPDSPAADLVNAQLLLSQKNFPGALASYQAALKKDPNNKLAQFLSAQVEARIGGIDAAEKTFSKLAAEAPTRRLEPGLTLTDASQSALAALEIDSGKAQQAIARLKPLLGQTKNPQQLRDYQWQLVAAHASLRDWSGMDTILQAILADPKTTSDEIVRAANYRRSANQVDLALTMLDAVLAKKPTDPGAAALKGFILADRKAYAEAVAVVTPAWKADKAPVSLALLLAALENGVGPDETRNSRSEKVLVDALARYPESTDLIRAIYSMRRGVVTKPLIQAWLNDTIGDKASPQLRRLKATILTSEGEFDAADKILADLILQSPQDLTLVMERLQALRTRAGQLKDQADREQVRAVNSQLDQLIATYRTRFASNPEIFAFEAELAADRGQADRAIEISRRIDALNPTSPLGPLVRLRVLKPRRQWPEIIKNLEDAIARDPRRRDLKLQLATVYAEQGRGKEAQAQVDQVLAAEPGQADATLLKSRLLVQNAAENDRPAVAIEAIKILEPLATASPDNKEVYEEAAALARFGGKPELATAWLERGLKAHPADPNMVSLLLENRAGTPELKPILARWSAEAEKDTTGRLPLAVSVALQRMGMLDEALKLARLATAKSGTPGAWLNQGGILLAMAEASPQANRQQVLEEAITAYDNVLTKAPDAVEAVNNKAWILHHYLARHQSASELVESFIRRADPARLPAEFDDTVGSIRESVAQIREAEKAYASGLAKSPAHAMLNYHMGRLVAADPGRRTNAVAYLQKAIAGQLPEAEATQAKRMLADLQAKSATPATIRAN